MPEEGSAKQNLGDPPAHVVQVIIGPARHQWDIPPDLIRRDVYWNQTTDEKEAKHEFCGIGS